MSAQDALVSRADHVIAGELKRTRAIEAIAGSTEVDNETLVAMDKFMGDRAKAKATRLATDLQVLPNCPFLALRRRTAFL